MAWREKGRRHHQMHSKPKLGYIPVRVLLCKHCFLDFPDRLINKSYFFILILKNLKKNKSRKCYTTNISPFGLKLEQYAVNKGECSH